jgi:hypothetical protein
VNTEQDQQQDKPLLYRSRTDDLAKDPGEYKELERRIYIIKEVFTMLLVTAKGTKMEDAIHKGIRKNLDQEGHNEVDRHYPQIGWGGIPVAIKQADGKGQQIEDPDRYAGYGKNIKGHLNPERYNRDFNRTG